MIPLGATPVDPDEARERLLRELSKSEYRSDEGFIPWLLRSLEEWLYRMLDGVDGSSALQGGLAVLVALLLIIAALLVMRRTGVLRRSHALTVPTALDSERDLTASELRAQAQRALDAARTDDSAVLAMRALVRDLEERTLLDVTAGMTAHEATERAGAAFPELRGRLRRGADAFDTAAYSHRSTAPKQAEDLLRLAEYISETSPDLTAVDDAPDVAVAPTALGADA